MLPAGIHSLLRHLDIQGTLVDHFLESIPQRPMYLHGAPNDPASQLGL